MIDRIMGVIGLKTEIYREIADDTTATTQAATIVVIVTIITSFFGGLLRLDPNGSLQIRPLAAIFGTVLGVVFALVGWAFTAWVLSFIAGLLGGKTNTGEMLRVTGYVEIFNLVSLLSIVSLVAPLLSCITGLVTLAAVILRLVGYVIGVREAGEFTTGKAILTAIGAAIVNFVIVTLIGGGIITFLAAAFAIASR